MILRILAQLYFAVSNNSILRINLFGACEIVGNRPPNRRYLTSLDRLEGDAQSGTTVSLPVGQSRRSYGKAIPSAMRRLADLGIRLKLKLREFRSP